MAVSENNRYFWTDFEPDEGDEIPGKYILTIWEGDPDDEKEFATIVHRTQDGTFPLDGRIANEKREHASRIVNALNGAAYRERKN